MEVDDIQIDGFKGVSDKRKKILVSLIGVLVLVGLVVVIIGDIHSGPLTVRFSDGKITPGSTTELIIVFRNTGNTDLRHVEFKITSETPKIMINTTDHVEEVIGAGSYRKMEIPIKVEEGLTQGTYRITVDVRSGEKEYVSNVHLEIAG